MRNFDDFFRVPIIMYVLEGAFVASEKVTDFRNRIGISLFIKVRVKFLLNRHNCTAWVRNPPTAVAAFSRCLYERMESMEVDSGAPFSHRTRTRTRTRRTQTDQMNLLKAHLNARYSRNNGLVLYGRER